MDLHRGRAVRTLGVIVALSLAAAPVLGGAGNAPFYSARDNSVYEEGPLSNGAGEHMFSGSTAFLSARRALLYFDVAAGTIPPDGTVMAVGLTIWCTKSPSSNDVPQTFSLHRLTADWGEAGSDAGDPGGFGTSADPGDATWTERFFGQGMPWATPGGDHVGAASSSAVVGTCFEGSPTNVFFDSTPDLVADVQAWLDDPASNFGWILIGNEDDATTARRFSTREHHNSPQAPLLDVFYEVDDGVPATSPTGAMLLVLLVVTASAIALRRM